MGDGYAAIQRRGGLPVSRGRGQSDNSVTSSVTTQSIALKYVVDCEPYRYI